MTATQLLNEIWTQLGYCRTEDMDSSKSRKQTILDAEFFSGRDDLMLRTDLLDLHVYICAPEVLLLFSDNFDYQVKRFVCIDSVEVVCAAALLIADAVLPAPVQPCAHPALPYSALPFPTLPCPACPALPFLSCPGLSFEHSLDQQ